MTRNINLWVLMGKVVSTLDNQKRREVPPFGINTFNYYNLFPITRLNGLTSPLLIGANNY